MKIYVATINELKQDISTYIPLLNKTRQEKVNRYIAMEPKLQSMYSGLLLRYAYKSNVEDMPWENVDVVYGENGKPYITDHENIHISNSHSKKMCAVCFDSNPVGIDIQYFQEIESHIIDRFFTEEEIALYNKTPDNQKDYLFYRMWCMKEACSKMNGDGIPMGLTRYIYISENEAFDKTLNQVINIHFYEVDKDYLCCVASAHTSSFPEATIIVNDEFLFSEN